ncbi:hypothetical protein ACHAWF_001220 [Thalassiosira exigua]
MISHHPLKKIFLLVATLGASNGFLSPSPGREDHRTPSTLGAKSSTALCQSSEDDDGSDGSSAINIAFITAATSNDKQDELQTTLTNHPFCKMTGVQLSISDVPASAGSASSWTKDDVSCLQRADIACFESILAVQSYLERLDKHWDIPKDMSDEDRRKLPNKPDPVEDILGAKEGAVPATSDSRLLAACPNADTGRECLNSGRWMSNHIYYPKDSQNAVELKTEPIGGNDNGDDGVDPVEENDINIDVDVWAESVVQAAGDVMERKFWGGGW